MFPPNSSLLILWCGLGVMLWWGHRSAQAETVPAETVAVVVGEKAPELERYAAGQLCGYLEALFGLRVYPTAEVPETAEVLFLLGSPATNPAVREATEPNPFPQVSDQGLVLRRLEF